MVLVLLVSCRDNFEVRYYDNGSIKSKAKTRNGVYNGEFFTYYPSGKLKSKGIWINGIGNGQMRRYFENGMLEEKSEWKNKVLHGDVCVYYPSGRIRLKALYREGCKTGNYIVYNESGLVLERHIYDEECNLYYLVKFDNSRQKSLELFFPSIKFLNKSDSVEVQFYSRINFSGKCTLEIGKKMPGFVSISESKGIKFDEVSSFSFPRGIDFNEFFYSMEFLPSEADTLGEFLIEKRLLKQAPDESIKHFSLDFP